MNKKCVIVWVVFSIVMVFNTSFGVENSEKLTIDRFIKTAVNDLKFKNQKELTHYLEGAASSTPYIDKIEFRSKTEEFEIYKQKYSLRFYPKGWGETEQTERVAELVKTSCRTEQSNLYNAALKQRYEMVLAYIESKNLIALKKKLALVCEDKISVLRKKSAGSLSFDIDDLISTEELIIKLRLELVELNNKITGLTHQIRIAANSEDSIAFDNESLIKVSEIKEIIDKLTPEATHNNISLEAQKNKVDLANSKYKLEQAKNRDFLSFFQISYDNDDYEEPQKAYSVEFAIKLPFINSDRDEVNRKKANYMKERLKYREEKSDLFEKKISLTRSLDQLIKQYSLLESNKSNSNAEVSFKTYLKIEGMDPLNLLKIKRSMIQSDIQLEKTGFNIRYRFIELMDKMGNLSKKPFTNYIGK